MKEVRFAQKSFLYINSLICEIWSDLYDFSPKGRLNFYFDTPSFLKFLLIHVAQNIIKLATTATRKK